jgi:macrolide-specific efflux system membrane fusion protein
MPEARAAEQSEARPAQSEPRKGGERRARGGDGTPRERAYTVRVVKDGRIEERRITVGVMNRIQAQVLSGLAEGEEVVVGTREEEKAQPRAQSKGGGSATKGRL